MRICWKRENITLRTANFISFSILTLLLVCLFTQRQTPQTKGMQVLKLYNKNSNNISFLIFLLTFLNFPFNSNTINFQSALLKPNFIINSIQNNFLPFISSLKLTFFMFPSFTKSKRSSEAKSMELFNTERDDKSFHILKQTICHNFFKKVKASEFHLKENHFLSTANFTHSSVPSKWNQSLRNSVHEKDKIIEKLMKRKKGELENDINHGLLKVNHSFNRYITGKSSEEEKITQQRKKTVSCKNILKELKHMQPLKNLNFPLANINQKNLLEMAAETTYEISNLQSKCLDSMFPFERYGASISSYQNELILYGGFSSGKRYLPFSCFHKYNFDTKVWTKVEEPATKPITIIPCFHTIDVYKNYMIVVGGISIGPEGGKRKYNSDICIFNFEKKEWSKLRLSLPIRSHATTLFGNTLLIHGGIDDKEMNSNQMHFINFNANSIQNSIILSTQNREYSLVHKNSLSHHKLVNTNEIDPNLKILLKYDGVFCFGGIDKDGQMHNDITFLNCIGKENALDVRFQSWIPIDLNVVGPKPQARKNHSLNVINKKALILLIGGQNMYGQVLSDIWVFNLIKLEWKQINQLSNPLSQILSQNHIIKELKLQEGISGHASTFIGSRLVIFGGRKSVQNKKDNSLWALETDVVNTLMKNMKIEKSNTPSVNTIKDFTKDESMWNIQF